MALERRGRPRLRAGLWIGADTIRHIHGWRVAAEIRNTEGRWDADQIGEALNTVVFGCRAPRMGWESAVQLGDPIRATWPPVAPQRIPTGQDDSDYYKKSS